jgi:hypothetical protein
LRPPRICPLRIAPLYKKKKFALSFSMPDEAIELAALRVGSWLPLG